MTRLNRPLAGTAQRWAGFFLFMEDLAMQATATPSAMGGKRLLSSEEVEGVNVYGTDGKKIGSIDHLMIERVQGQVVYAVVDFGGFLGMGQSHYPVPWSTLNYDLQLDGYRTNVTKDQLKTHPNSTTAAMRTGNGKRALTRIMARTPIGPTLP